ERYSPVVGLEDGPRPQGLLLDISGCAACFRGEDRLLERAGGELGEQGGVARVAIADTLGAAVGLAHYAHTPSLAPPGATEDVLTPLPIAALRLPADVLDLLARLGFERVGQLLALPRAGVPARFGGGVLLRLDQALGRVPEVLVSHRLVPEVQVVYAFDFAVDRLHVLQAALEQLTEQVHDRLQRRQWGARQIECRLYQEGAPPLVLEVSLFRASRSLRHVRALLRNRLERIQLTRPVWALGLLVTRAEPLTDAQAELFEAASPQEKEGFTQLIDALSNRLGHGAVTRPTLVADAQPEHACRFE